MVLWLLLCIVHSLKPPEEIRESTYPFVAASELLVGSAKLVILCIGLVPESFMFPEISNFSPGLFVPTPTLPPS